MQVQLVLQVQQVHLVILDKWDRPDKQARMVHLEPQDRKVPQAVLELAARRETQVEQVLQDSLVLQAAKVLLAFQEPQE